MFVQLFLTLDNLKKYFLKYDNRNKLIIEKLEEL